MTVTLWLDACVTPLLLLATLLLSPVPRYLLTLWTQDRSVKHRHHRRTTCSGGANDAEEACEGSGFIVPACIHHARMLPRESRHSFQYPSIYYAFELHALEQRKLDRTSAFAWTGDTLRMEDASKQKQANEHVKLPGWSVTKLHPHNFGRKTFPEATSATTRMLSGSILLKLMYELRFRGYINAGPQDIEAERLQSGACPWKSEVGQVWAIAMPTIFGLAGFNPLTVYYVYRPFEHDAVHGSARGPLWLCVLEVHNTFNERHIYICEIGRGEDAASTTTVNEGQEKVRAGYDHSWTFARDFHVSPFNDRSGYYRLFLRDMWRPNEAAREPTIDVRLLLLTSHTMEPEPSNKPDSTVIQSEQLHEQSSLPSLQKKLLATLASSQASSATPRSKRAAQAIEVSSVASALFHQPLDLLLPVARIMWEAAKLHWKRRLPVYIRPEPTGDASKTSVDVCNQFDGVGWPAVHNPAEGSSSKARQWQKASSGGIFWNNESFIERACRILAEKYLNSKARQVTSAPVRVRLSNPEVADVLYSNGQSQPVSNTTTDTADQLTFYAMSPALFTDLCLYVPSHALLFGSRVERGWGVNSTVAFEEVFSTATPTTKTARGTSSFSVRFARFLRTSFMRWAVMEALQHGIADEKAAKIGARLIQEADSPHPFDCVGYSFGVLLALVSHIAVLRLTASASSLLRVRYVRRPWAQVGEGIAVLASAGQSHDACV